MINYEATGQPSGPGRLGQLWMTSPFPSEHLAHPPHYNNPAPTPACNFRQLSPHMTSAFNLPHTPEHQHALEGALWGTVINPPAPPLPHHHALTPRAPAAQGRWPYA
eukprot:scaffold21287_cov22-Tisochrysis_lutea.AAC.3